jgi:crotonobetainyl-CoA:carnitine CoA-transferase CaiB-like acyl-CoA transferase
VAPLYNVAEVLEDPQVRYLDLVEEVAHPQAGKLQFVGGPVGYDGLAKAPSSPPPLLGEHTAAILKELGYDPADVEKLVAQGITKVVQS